MRNPPGAAPHCGAIRRRPVPDASECGTAPGPRRNQVNISPITRIKVRCPALSSDCHDCPSSAECDLAAAGWPILAPPLIPDDMTAPAPAAPAPAPAPADAITRAAIGPDGTGGPDVGAGASPPAKWRCCNRCRHSGKSRNPEPQCRNKRPAAVALAGMQRIFAIGVVHWSQLASLR